MTTTACPFCTLPPERILGENHHAIWLRDGYPVSPGHSLIIPKRHVGSFFKATGDERLSLFALLDDAKRVAQDVLQPDGFNIGINDGAAAGQTVPHLHIHLIPRYRDDMADPRGGVRWVIPALADYWSKRPAPRRPRRRRRPMRNYDSCRRCNDCLLKEASPLLTSMRC